MHNDSYFSPSKFRGAANRFLTVIGLVLLVVLGARAQSQLTDPAMVQGKPRLGISPSGTSTLADLLAVGSRGISPVSAIQNEQKTSVTTTSKPAEAAKDNKTTELNSNNGPDSESANKKQLPAVTASSAPAKTIERAKRP